MPVGICGLCRTPNMELRDSHFLPAGFYRLARDEDRANPNPVLVNQQVSLASSEQAKAHFLCARCERRFNDCGEDWVLKNCWHNDSEFPLRSALLAAPPSPLSSKGFTIYEGASIPEVEADQLAYFGASIFWRGAARNWVFMKRHPTRLELGPYAEQLRCYLLDEAPFPEDAVLVVVVSSGMEAMRNMVIVFPFFKNRHAGFRQYRFTVPGITYQLFVGKGLPKDMRGLCSVRSRGRFVFMVPDVDATNMGDMAAVVNKTRTVGSLARPNPRRSR